MTDTLESSPGRPSLTADERAAARSFLQRCEVRLSTMHRVATALLSGAGILVLVPAVQRDSILHILRTLLTGSVSWSRGLTALSVVIALALTLTVLWLLILELTRFYFHANHIVHEGSEVFTPRFTLTGLRLPSDELDPTSATMLDRARHDALNVQLLVPANDRARARIDRRAKAYPGLLMGNDDFARATMMFELAAEDVPSSVEFGVAAL